MLIVKFLNIVRSTIVKSGFHCTCISVNIIVNLHHAGPLKVNGVLKFPCQFGTSPARFQREFP